MELQVVKKNGSKETFLPDKIARVATAAGLTPKQGQKLAQEVAQWFKNLGKTQVTTLEIRNKVIEKLSEVNQFTADAFTWYEKTKDGD